MCLDGCYSACCGAAAVHMHPVGCWNWSARCGRDIHAPDMAWHPCIVKLEKAFSPTRSADGSGRAGDDMATACIIVLAGTAGL